MTPTLDFYFDFSSPYSFIASKWIGPLAAKHGFEVHWKPVLLGVIFKECGNQSPIAYKHKDAYSLMDFERSARFEGLQIKMPAPFPIATHNAARIFLWLQISRPDTAQRFADAAFDTYWLHGKNLSDPSVIMELAHASGLSNEQASAVMQDEANKALLKTSNEQALAAGVFGAPFFVVGEEKFWGNDRKAQLEWHLERLAKKESA